MSQNKRASIEVFKNNRLLLTLLFFVGFVSVYVFLKIYVYAPSENKLSYYNNNFYVLGLNIPTKLDFCGEGIPTNDLKIREDLEKEFLTDNHWKAHSKQLFARAQRWFPVIEPILKEENVPDDFKYLAVIESHLSNATSPVGASGFWQLVPSSAYNYGLEVNDLIDERYDVEKATHAACAHIKDAYAVFKNWTLAAAAYNRGIGGIQQALKKQNTNNYYDLLLNSETGSFVYRILAFKTLLSSPSHFGVKNKFKKRASKINFKIYKIDTTVTNVARLAKHIGSNIIVIKQFNPWLLGNSIINPAKKTYHIKLPKNKTADYSEYISDLEHELIIKSDSTTRENTTPADSASMHKKTINYLVRVDEPLENLAKFFSVKVEDLRKWNNLPEGQNAVKGQTLTIYHFSK